MKPALSEQDHDLLVGLIYDCVAKPDNWAVFLQVLTTKLGIKSGLVRVQDLQDKTLGFCACHGIEPSFFKDYEEKHIANDPLIKKATELTTGEFIKRSDFISDEDYFQSDFYHDYTEPNGNDYVYGGLIARSGQRVVSFGVQNSLQHGDFSSAQEAAIQRLSPHMQRAFELSQLLNTMEKKLACLHQVMEHGTFAIIVVDAQASVLTSNSLAKRIVAKGELDISSGRLIFPLNNEQAHFQQALVEVMNGVNQSSSLSLSRKLGDQAYILQLSPIDNRENSEADTRFDKQNRAAALFIYDPEQSVIISSEILRQKYKLSPAEIRLAQSLADGASLESSAEQFFVSKNTLRAQLRSIFTKTQTHSQAELLRLLLSLPKAQH